MGWTKKGQMDPWSLMALLFNPWVLLGIGVFALILVLLSFFMLGKVLGSVLVLAGTLMLVMQRAPWYVGAMLLVAGVFMLWNPGDMMALNFMPFG